MTKAFDSNLNLCEEFSDEEVFFLSAQGKFVEFFTREIRMRRLEDVIKGLEELISDVSSDFYEYKFTKLMEFFGKCVQNFLPILTFQFVTSIPDRPLDSKHITAIST